MRILLFADSSVPYARGVGMERGRREGEGRERGV